MNLKSSSILVLILLAIIFQNPANAAEKVKVQIEIVADSSNIIEARLEVEKGINARALMDELFQMVYMDPGRKFVVGIAGIIATPKDNIFWKLEIDGEPAQIGIADVIIEKSVRLRWVVTPL